MDDKHEHRNDEPNEGHKHENIEDETFEAEIEDAIDEEDMQHGGRQNDTFGADALFGRDGVFGKDGPFGRNGPFGRDGPFGDNGPFAGQFAGAFGGGRRGSRGKWKMAGVHDAGQHHRRRKRMFRPGELRLVLLSLIAEAPRHGYELIKEIEEMTGGEYSPSPGVIYPTIALLEDEGLIEPVDGNESRKAFRVTTKGEQELGNNAEEVARLMQRLGRQAQQARPMRSSDMLRSLGNLATVIANRAANGEMTGERKDKAVDLIDELARKIERL